MINEPDSSSSDEGGKTKEPPSIDLFTDARKDSNTYKLVDNYVNHWKKLKIEMQKSDNQIIDVPSDTDELDSQR